MIELTYTDYDPDLCHNWTCETDMEAFLIVADFAAGDFSDGEVDYDDPIAATLLEAIHCKSLQATIDGYNEMSAAWFGSCYFHVGVVATAKSPKTEDEKYQRILDAIEEGRKKYQQYEEEMKKSDEDA